MGGPVKLNGVVIFAFVAPNGENGIGVRISTDDWERPRAIFPVNRFASRARGVDGKLSCSLRRERNRRSCGLRFRPLASRIARLTSWGTNG